MAWYAHRDPGPLGSPFIGCWPLIPADLSSHYTRHRHRATLLFLALPLHQTASPRLIWQMTTRCHFQPSEAQKKCGLRWARSRGRKHNLTRYHILPVGWSRWIYNIPLFYFIFVRGCTCHVFIFYVFILCLEI